MAYHRRLLVRLGATLSPLFTRQPARPWRRLLVVRPDHLGDLLFLTPALRALRAAFPRAEIVALVGPWGAEVLQHNPWVDRVLAFPFPWFDRRPRRSAFDAAHRLWRLVRRLRDERFDCALSFRADFWWGALALALAGIPVRVGFAHPLVSPLLTHRCLDPGPLHEVERNLVLLTRLGVPAAPGPLEFSTSRAERQAARDLLARAGVPPGAPFLVVHPGAGGYGKHWTVEGWAAVVRALQAEGWRVVLTGGAAERALTAAIQAQLTRPVVDLAGQTSLGVLAAVLQRAALVLGPDCGPLHLAVALGTPTVHLFGPSDPTRFGPYGPPDRHLVVRAAVTCPACQRYGYTPDQDHPHICMAAITPEMVLAAVRALSTATSLPRWL